MDKELKRIRNVTTPEGLTLAFSLCGIGNRIAAFGLDFFLMCLVWFVILLATALVNSSIATAVAMVAMFFVMNFYFIFFELRWSGSTPGKKKFGMRAIARDGGPLTAEMVIARNLTRELEVFLPIKALLIPEAFLPGAPVWMIYVSLGWLLIFSLLPFFGKDKLRCGDLLGGTMVVFEPKTVLSRDLADTRIRRRGNVLGGTVEEYTFTQEQLDLYGIRELQVLEDILRRQEQGIAERAMLDAVCKSIRKKIGWPRSHSVKALPFLRAFYKAQRGRLENKMLMGERTEIKTKTRLRSESRPPEDEETPPEENR